MDHPQRVVRDHGQFMIGKVDDAVGMAGQGARIAGDKVLAIAHADHQWTAEPGGHEQIRLPPEEHEQPIRATQLLDRLPHRHHPGRVGDLVGHPGTGFERPREAAVDQMGDHFRIGLRLEDIALGRQSRLELPEVFHDAVVDDRQRGAIDTAPEMRMRVPIGGSAVGGPAGVPDPHRGVGHVVTNNLFQPCQPAGRLANMELALVVEHGQSR